jgi:serine/threonine-protein kinase
MSLLTRLKERKLVQWALAYLAGAWVFLEATGFVAENFAWPQRVIRGLTLVVGVGFFVTLVLAWYHGEKGRQRVSGPELLMLTALFLIAGITLSLLGPPTSSDRASGEAPSALPTAADDPRPSIAVLPFANRSDQGGDQHFADGIHDELLTRLSRISGLRVLSRGVVQEYRDAPKSNLEIGRELGIGYLLEGGVQRIGDRIRVNVQLIDASNEGHVWAETFDRELTSADLFDIQSEITQSVAEELRAAISEEEGSRIANRSTDHLGAYELYLTQRAVLFDYALPRAERFSNRQLLLERAIELDPEFALAHAALARVRSTTYFHGYDRSEERARLARAALRRAQELEPELPEVHYSLGHYYYRVERDYARALDAFATSETSGLRGDYSLAYFRGHVRRRDGRWQEAISSYEQAIELNPRSASPLGDLGLTYTLLRRYEEAEPPLRRALRLQPAHRSGQWYRAWLPLLRDGDTEPMRRHLAEYADPEYEVTSRWRVEFFDRDWDAALSVVARAKAAADSEILEEQYVLRPYSLYDAWTLAAADNAAQATALFQEAAARLEKLRLEREDDSRLHNALALAYAGLGRRDDAVREAEQALEMWPPERDALDGPWNVWALCLVHAGFREAETAVECLDGLLSIPSRWSIVTINMDPRLDPLPDHPRFQALLEKYESEH